MITSSPFHHRLLVYLLFKQEIKLVLLYVKVYPSICERSESGKEPDSCKFLYCLHQMGIRLHILLCMSALPSVTPNNLRLAPRLFMNVVICAISVSLEWPFFHVQKH